MVKDFYDQKDQRVFYTPEIDITTNTASYGQPLGGTAWTAPSETYPYWQRLNIMGGSIDTPVPYRKKEPVYDIGSGKHPSHIINQMIEPIDYSFDMELQDGAMLAYAIGDAAHAGSIKEAGTILCVDDVADSLDGTYFFIESIDTDANGDPQLYCVWIDTNNSGTTYPGPTEIPAANRKEVTTITTGMLATDVATQVELTLEGLDIVSSAATGTITWECDNEGSCMNARDSQAAPTGFTFTNTTEGASTITITENIGHSLRSFTLYVQQKNAGDSSEDLCKVYFGCVVQTYTMVIDRDSHTIKHTVGIKCPYAIDGTVSTEPPPINRAHPFTWNTLQSDELILGVGSTDYSPKSTNVIELTIENNVEIKSEISSLYNQHPISAKRDVSMKLVGFTDSNDLYDLYEDIWNNTEGYLTSAGARLESDINIERTTSTDYLRIYVYNWFVEEHDFKVFSITDAIKGVDLTLRGGTPYTDGRLFTDGSTGITIVSTDNLRKYHNT